MRGRALLAIATLALPVGVALAIPTRDITAPAKTLYELPKPEADERPAIEPVEAAMAARSAERRLFRLDEALKLLPRPTPYRGLVQCLRASAFADLDRVPELVGPIEECHRLLPDYPYAQTMMAWVRILRNDARGAALLLTSALTADPAMADGLAKSLVTDLVGRLEARNHDAERDALLTALVAAGFGTDDPVFFSRIAARAIRLHLDRGRRAEAVAMLPLVLDPDTGLELLIDRQFEPIWPDIEAWAGGDLKAQRTAYVRAARAAYDLDRNIATLRAYAEVLAKTGYRADAIEKLDAVLARPELWDARRVEAARAAILLARLKRVEGDRKGAAAVLARVSDAAVDPTARVALNAERARNLIADGRAPEALALLDRPALAGPAGLEPGRGERLALRACALQKAVYPEAESARAAAREAPQDDPAILAELAACFGAETERAAWLAALGDADRRPAALVALARARALGDPIVAARAAALGRALPPGFGAALLQWRTGP